jgi:ERCC4-type nuclease
MDDRERRGPIPELLVGHNEFDLEIHGLPAGDYLLELRLLQRGTGLSEGAANC